MREGGEKGQKAGPAYLKVPKRTFQGGEGGGGEGGVKGSKIFSTATNQHSPQDLCLSI